MGGISTRRLDGTTMMTTGVDRPARRTRPKDRKQRILETAADLFRGRGYHGVGMSDIAGALGIVPSALYRHYRSKHDLLVAVLDAALVRYEQAVEGVDDWATASGRIAQAALDVQAFDVLWSRDSGNLCPAEYEVLFGRLRGVGRRVAAMIDVGSETGCVPSWTTAWAVFAALDWPGHRPLSVPVADQRRTLASAVDAIVVAGRRDVGRESDTGSTSSADELSARDALAGLRPASRREALLSTAITMFAVRGYQTVSLDDIGDAVGIAGPSVYNHFASKREIVASGVSRAFESLWLTLGQVLRSTSDPRQALDDLLDHYARFAYEHWDLITVCLSHSGILDDAERAVLGRTYLDYVSEWRRLEMECRPELSPDEAQTLVDLALAVVDGVVRIPTLREPGLPADARYLAQAVLDAQITSR
ncbi:TetR family transcriptional regulator [Gordonia sp. SID5947]|uniref:TetR/AcrR family transcriptional regulator n=1 Tax=Gordonia sp. SID5947 TaxID=2690315 RepID=UPI001371053A|nr:TetR/AcrR family transcriptional regulator [Gordonia sp. SID5947]MYR07610.1 TetR family transcriptional regulator [Gordonia sp. SID5947]